MSRRKVAKISPAAAAKANEIGAVFTMLHTYVRTLGHSQRCIRLRYAHARIDEAAMWAVKHVLTEGVKKTKAKHRR